MPSASVREVGGAQPMARAMTVSYDEMEAAQ